MSKDVMREALTRIAEGNLGDAPWQANYSAIKRIATEALAAQPAQPAQELVYVQTRYKNGEWGTPLDPKERHSRWADGVEARLLYTAQQPQQPAQQEIDWKDQYEKQKRRADMWIAKYEADIGPLEKAGPVAAPQPAQDPVGLTDGEGNELTLLQAIDHAIKATEKSGSHRLHKILAAAKKALAQPVQQAAIPDGWKLVPEKATPEMCSIPGINDMAAEMAAKFRAGIWEEMLSRIPAAPKTQASAAET